MDFTSLEITTAFAQTSGAASGATGMPDNEFGIPGQHKFRGSLRYGDRMGMQNNNVRVQNNNVVLNNNFGYSNPAFASSFHQIHYPSMSGYRRGHHLQR